jgi:hypothetical protein
LQFTHHSIISVHSVVYAYRALNRLSFVLF